jgi:hypothetical protein
MNLRIFIIGISLFTACTNRGRDTNLCREIFFDEESELRDVSPTYRFIPLETRTDNLIGSVSKVEIAGDRIFVLDMQTADVVQVYDINGKYITRIGAKGNGPGEYIKPHTLSPQIYFARHDQF